MIELRPATLRDASFVTANLRPLDQLEVFCQMPPNTKTHELAYGLIFDGETYCSFYKGKPAALYGVGAINVCTLTVWAIGTKDMRRTVPAITRHLMEEILPRKIEEGFTSAEARSIVGHHSAHRWMKSLGGVPWGEPFLYGSGGELFQLFRWTAEGYRRIMDAKQNKAISGDS